MKSVSKKNKIATHRLAIINTPSPIGICKTMKSKKGTSSDMKTIGCRSFEVVEYAFNSSPMGVGACMY
jgi:hypothetical protein